LIFNSPKRIDEVLNDLPVFSKAQIEGSGPGLKKGLDFAVLTALYEDEFQIYKEHCDLTVDSIVANGYHTTFLRKNEAIKSDYEKPFALVHQEQMGVVDAAIYATQIIDKVDPRFLLMGGVCGGLKAGVQEFDIIIPTIVYDYSTGKLIGGERPGKEGDDPSPMFNYETNGSDKVVKGRVETKGFKSNAEKLLTEFIIRRKEDIITNMRQLMPETQKVNFPTGFDIHVDEFACGPWVVKTDGFLDEYLLKEFSNKIKGLEMESYSINRAGNIVQKYGRYSLVIKSVMDYTDTKKSDGQKGYVKKFAALMSLVCIRAMMPILLDFKDPKVH
jgi:nucleoside phosphorylase